MIPDVVQNLKTAIRMIINWLLFEPALKPIYIRVIILFIIGLLILIFANSRDLIISCQSYSIDAGITCPLNK